MIEGIISEGISMKRANSNSDWSYHVTWKDMEREINLFLYGKK